MLLQSKKARVIKEKLIQKGGLMAKDYAIITIKVNIDIKNALEKMKIHPREPFWEVIERLIKSFESKKENE